MYGVHFSGGHIRGRSDPPACLDSEPSLANVPLGKEAL